MKMLFDESSFKCSRIVTTKYSTSFSLAVKLLSPKIRDGIYSIYAFVRCADEIVDSFHNYNKAALLDQFERDYYKAYADGISLNPVLNSFVITVKKYNITDDLIQHFLDSMKKDLYTSSYFSKEDYKAYIYGSADVVGLMCLKVFALGDEDVYNKLKQPAMRLGSAFQKVNFLRDLKDDYELLNRSYFPGVNFKSLDQSTKLTIIDEIEDDFKEALKGIKALPLEAKLGVYTAFVYYKKLLKKLKRTPSNELLKRRIRISNPIKLSLMARSFVAFKFNLL